MYICEYGIAIRIRQELEPRWQRQYAKKEGRRATVSIVGRALNRVLGDLLLPLLPGEANLFDSAGAILGTLLVPPPAADSGHFVLKGSQPIGQIETGPGWFLRQTGDFAL
jgi:hypothetical protein